ncbi:MAG: VOC family protein [Pseudomonadota bacterium]
MIGCFSVSLSVKDLSASRTFYEALGFEAAHGDMAHGFVIMQNGTTKIGLFQGMFEGNILTFNPGWDDTAQVLDTFEDVRATQSRLQSQGIAISVPTEADGTGPASIQIVDPDGNVIMLDQHVGRPLDQS